MYKEILRMEQIVTYIGDAKILNNAKLNLFDKEIIGIVGVNYSGKSNLVGGITGLFPYTSGRTFYYEKPVRIASMEEAQEKGIFYIQPKSALIDKFTITENVFLKKEKGEGFISNKNQLEGRTTELLKMFNLSISQDMLAEELSYRNKIVIEICKAIVRDAKVIVLDSVIGGISEESEDYLFNIFSILKALHISVIIVESRLKPLKAFCNRLFVLRQGRTVGILKKEEFDDNKIITLMTGHKINDKENEMNSDGIKDSNNKELLLSFENVFYNNILKNISFSIYKNEILGILNVNKNSGRAIEKILTGLDTVTKGSIIIDDKKVAFKNTEEALENGITIVPEKDNIFQELSLEENITLSSLKMNSNKLGVINKSELKYINDELITEFLSKGSKFFWTNNIPEGWLMHKKISFCRALAPTPKLMILMNPTQKIDIVYKKEIYEDIFFLKENNISVLIISSDINELVSVCERLLVIKNGKVIDSISLNEEIKYNILNKYGKYLREI
ncbi:MAG: ATP-binding cassette domain-containing protein [bacterium]